MDVCIYLYTYNEKKDLVNSHKLRLYEEVGIYEVIHKGFLIPVRKYTGVKSQVLHL